MSEKAKDIYVVDAGLMQRFCVAACRKVGLSREHAYLLVDTLIQADLRGIDSHGVTRLPRHIKGYQIGGVNPQPSIRIVKESGATAVLDGDDGLGAFVSYQAMRLAMDKAAAHGVGTVTARKSNHYGMAAYWSMMALERDMIGYSTTNGPPGLAPWGGITPSYANNPVSYAIPSGKEWPIVLDMAMSVVAKGKIVLAALKNEPIPPSWAMDKEGQPTTVAQAAVDGLLQPIGGYKGYGMALVNDVLCGVLSGGLFGTDIPKMQTDRTAVAGYCHFFMALDISHFMPVIEFKERVDRIVSMMKNSQLAQGHDRIYLPGELEFKTHRRRLKEGIPYPKEIISQLEKLGQGLQIPTGFDMGKAG